MLTGTDIRSRALIVNAVESGFRGSSYDVRIEHIVTNAGDVVQSFNMPPQGIVQVVSAERVKLPRSVTGLAYVKTSLCNEGILALNMGIIDPGYDGPISTFLLNFSGTSRLLTEGETFLRLQFAVLDEPATTAGRPVDSLAYLNERRRQATRFGRTFMNVSEIVEKSINEFVSKWTNDVLRIAGSVALVLTVLTFLLNYGSLYLVKTWLQPADAARAEVLRAEADRLVKANEELRARVEALEKQVRPPISKP
jgi:dUTPase